MSRIEYETREYTEKDFPNIVELLELVFKDWPGYDLQCSPLEHGTWKFIDTPLNLHSIVLSEYESQIIGADLGIIKKTKIGDNIYLTNKGCETATHQDYRRKGVNSNVSRLKFELLERKQTLFHYGVTNNPILIKSHKGKRAQRTDFPHPIRYYVKIDDVSLHLKQEPNLSKTQYITYRIGIPILKLFTKIRNNLTSKPKSTNTQIEKILQFDDEINIFWDSIKDQYDFIVEKKRDYLNWRYCDPRSGKYNVWVAKEASRIVGFLVLKINSLSKDYKRGFLVEVLCLKDRLDVVDRLVNFASQYFEDNKINMIYAQVIQGHPLEKILNKNGFLDSRTNPILNMRIFSMNDDMKKFMETTPDRLHYSYGESDSV